MNRVSTLAFGLALATLAAGQPSADAQPNSPAPEASNAASTLSPVDYNFVAQANLGAPFQIDSGRVAEQKARIRWVPFQLVPLHLFPRSSLVFAWPMSETHPLRAAGVNAQTHVIIWADSSNPI